MKWLVLALILASGGWGVRIINEYELVIWNDLDVSITCYVYYDDGDFVKRRVRAYSESSPFKRYGLVEVECF